jgi:enoyl-CoA hydratase/carnithine racemase
MVRSAIDWQESDDGVVSLILDDPDQNVNTVNTAFVEALASAVERLEQVQDRIAGVIVRSAKKSFLAGGDLNRLMAVDPLSIREFVDDLNVRKSYTRRLELLHRPVVAIINGPALGGGLELALCCHRSIGIDDGSSIVGLPEANLGLIPGAGGIVRTVHRLGIDQALDNVLLPGRRFSLAEAVDAGLIDEVTASAEAAEAAARKWISSNPSAAARPAVSALGATRSLPAPSAAPARRAIILVANRSMATDLETALGIESNAFGGVVVSGATKNSIRTHFFATNAVRKRARNLSSEPLARVVLTPNHVSAVVTLEAGAWREIADVDEAVGLKRDERDPDVRVALPGLVERRWPQMWLAPDFVGDRQRVVEYATDGSSEAAAVISGLAKAGVVPIPVSAATGSFGRRLSAALADAVTECESLGHTAAAVDRALHWAELPWPERRKPEQPRPETCTQGDVELACAMLDRIAKAGLEAVEAGALTFAEDADVASVRAGGFPGWTGGVACWTARGRELVRELRHPSDLGNWILDGAAIQDRKVDQ